MRNRKLRLTSGPSAKGQVEFKPLSTDANPLNGVTLQGPDSVGASPITYTLPGSILNNGSLVSDASGNLSPLLLKNINIDPAAAIALTKLAPLAFSLALVSDGSGNVTTSAVTATELGYVSGVTSSIQTQLNGKQASGNYITALTGDIIASGPGSAASTYNNIVPVNKGGTGLGTLTLNNVLLGNGTSTPQFVAPGTSGNVLTSNGTTWSSTASASSPTSNYSYGNYSTGYTWNGSASASYADLPNATVGTFTATNSGITVTAPASNLLGITFTPASATAVYFVTLSFSAENNNSARDYAFKLTDGTIVVDENAFETNLAGSAYVPFKLSGVYAPGTASAVTLKVQYLSSVGNTIAGYTIGNSSARYSIYRIK